MNKIVQETIKEIQDMTPSEYEKLQQEADRMKDCFENMIKEQNKIKEYRK